MGQFVVASGLSRLVLCSIQIPHMLDLLHVTPFRRQHAITKSSTSIPGLRTARLVAKKKEKKNKDLNMKRYKEKRATETRETERGAAGLHVGDLCSKKMSQVAGDFPSNFKKLSSGYLASNSQSTPSKVCLTFFSTNSGPCDSSSG